MFQQIISHSSKVVIDQAVSEELNAFYMYQYLNVQCQRLGLFGASKYFEAESADELSHYRKHINFLNDRGDTADMPLIEPTNDTVDTLEDALTIAYTAELELGRKYDAWSLQVAQDPTTHRHLQQFIGIQQESVGKCADWLKRLSLANEVLLVDKELGELVV